MELILIGFFVLPFMLIVWYHATKEKRRERFVKEGVIWETGGMFGTGEKDIYKAIDFYESACDMGSCQGCFLLARFYREGVGVPKNITKFLELHKRARKLDIVEYEQLLIELPSEEPGRVRERYEPGSGY